MIDKEKILDVVKKKFGSFDKVVRCYFVKESEFYLVNVIKNNKTFIFRVYQDGKVEQIN